MSVTLMHRGLRSGIPYLRPSSWAGAFLLVGFMLSLPATVSAQDGGEYFKANVDKHVQSCMACHQAGGVAEIGGAKLVLSNEGGQRHALNYSAFESYLALADVDTALLLSKVSGGSGHGGGVAHAKGSAGYIALSELANYIENGVADGGGAVQKDFWRGLVLEPRERTLRRASILLAGKMPTAKQLKSVRKKDARLRKEVLKAMSGEGFHEFLITGADDQLHTLGFNNGLFLEFFTPDYPTDIDRQLERCEEVNPDGSDLFAERTTINGCNYWRFLGNVGIAREPLELIAHVVEKNLPYTQILTANYTVANRALNSLYQGGNSYPPLEPGDGVKLDEVWTFKRSVDRGQPDFRDWVEVECDPVCGNVRYDRLIDRPHAGVLTTPAFMSRYPSTDTNRNRARARWTYYHFLGVDIEKSAPRSTDPVALADIDNPTMKNPACTVCHE
ncbi:MAG: hypothetical protein V2I82_15675, partial [Halieaceae bacterium]|nr:hypothetical protein [Halieaceae bacterium]